MEYLNLYSVGGIIAFMVAAGLYYEYKVNKQTLIVGVKKVEDIVEGQYWSAVDSLINEAKAIITKMEDFAANKTKEVEGYVTQRLDLEGKIAAVNADIQKVTDFANKLKSIV